MFRLHHGNKYAFACRELFCCRFKNIKTQNYVEMKNLHKKNVLTASHAICSFIYILFCFIIFTDFHWCVVYFAFVIHYFHVISCSQYHIFVHLLLCWSWMEFFHYEPIFDSIFWCTLVYHNLDFYIVGGCH